MKGTDLRWLCFRFVIASTHHPNHIQHIDRSHHKRRAGGYECFVRWGRGRGSSEPVDLTELDIRLIWLHTLSVLIYHQSYTTKHKIARWKSYFEDFTCQKLNQLKISTDMSIAKSLSNSLFIPQQYKLVPRLALWNDRNTQEKTGIPRKRYFWTF